jgi:hypothetical protein
MQRKQNAVGVLFLSNIMEDEVLEIKKKLYYHALILWLAAGGRLNIYEMDI